MILSILLFVVCIILVSIVFKVRDKNYWKKRNVKQVGDLVFGVFSKGNKSLAEVYKDVYDNHPEEPFVGANLGTRRGLIIRNLQNVQTILANNFESFHSRGILTNKSDVLADNVLFIDEYERWKLIRQKISPIFTSAKLKNMYYIIEKTATDFVEMIKKRNEIRNTPFNALYTYTTASLGASIFGIDTQLESTMDSPFLEMAWKTITQTFTSNIKFTIANISPTLFRLFDFQLFGEHEDFFVGVVKKVLDARRKDKRTVHDFIDLCLEIQKNGTMKDLSTGYELEPTDEILAAQAFFFFLAGADTSSNTMHFTLLELAGHPQVLQRLHVELDSMFEQNDVITSEIIEKQQYLDMVLSEALRKYPPIGLMQRKCTRETVLPVGNLRIEKDVIVVVPVFGLHRDEKYYPSPEVFDPERFAPENVTQIPKMAYMPFGEGKRICLGMRYARLQVKTGLAFLLRSFTLRQQSYNPKNFEKSVFALRDAEAKYELILRENRS